MKKKTARQKATLSGVKQIVRPYLKRQMFHKYINSSDVSTVCRLLRYMYSNVEVAAKEGPDRKPYLKIKVKKFLDGGELSYEIRVKGKSIQTSNPLSWIDSIEHYDALMN